MNRETSGSIRTAPPLSDRLSLSWVEGRRLLIAGWSADELQSLEAGFGVPGLGLPAVYPADILALENPGMPPTAGVFEVADGALIFIPAFPPIGGARYCVVATTPGSPSFTVLGELLAPTAAPSPIAEVAALYPRAAALPLNHLRFYVHFSQPMREGGAERAISLRDAETGAELNDAVLPMPPELWDREHRRLTVLLDPGRIKRGLAPHEEAGYPLAEGSAFIFAVSEGFRDAHGRGLAGPFERRFEVGPALRTVLDPERWQIAPPAAGTVAPLRVEFDRPIDHALGERCFRVEDEVGAETLGGARLLAGETVMQFTPGAPWLPGCYALIVDRTLEDVAGNSLVRPFDRDLGDGEVPPWNGETPKLEFWCA